MPEIYLADKDEKVAKQSLENLKNVLTNKGFVTVADFYDSIGVSILFESESYTNLGWTNLDTSRVRIADDGKIVSCVVIDMPPCVDISEQVNAYYELLGPNDVKASIQKVAEAFGNNPITQIPYVIEEMSELTKELCKIHRHKPDKNKIIEEACDVLNSVAVLLYEMKVSDSEIFKNMIFKLDRALKRKENGEL